MELESGTFWLTRVVYLHYTGLIYGVAFLVSLHQNEALIGNNGLLPADIYMKRILSYSDDSRWMAFKFVPTIFWFFDWERDINTLIYYTSLCGFLIAAFVCLTGCANMIMMFLLWVFYHSINSVGQTWYGFGWESQLLETGFLAMFMVPVLRMERFPKNTPTPYVCVWANRWLVFRIMLGAGLIKLRGDACWKDLTCMHYHYETQPVPNPMSWYLHHMPGTWHKVEVLGNHFVECLVPWFMFLGRAPCILNGFFQISFQILLIISGNLSFLNWLTILPSIPCLDDKFFANFLPQSYSKKVVEIRRDQMSSTGRSYGYLARQVVNVCLAILIAYLSVPVVKNLLSQRQAMNTSFEPLRIVNTYGAFGSITKKRTEVILQGTHASDPFDRNAEWLEYEFKCKPGDTKRRPCLISPYHYRLDWLMWFAAFQNPQSNAWFFHLIAKLLANDELVTNLIAKNPFKAGDPPLWIRAQHYRYVYTKPRSVESVAGHWYSRTYMGSYLPPQSLNSIRSVVNSQGWKLPVPKHLRRGMKDKKSKRKVEL